MRLLVTRPEPDGNTTAARLRSKGHDVIYDPMLRIAFEPPAPLPDGIQALAATSANAVRALAARADADIFRALPLFTVGGATARTASAEGFTSVVSADGNVDALHDLLVGRIDPAAGAVLYVCGRDRTGDLEIRLAGHGISAPLLVAYRADGAERLAAETVTAIEDENLDAILLYSRRTAGIFIRNLAAAGLLDKCRPCRALCLSEAVAAPLVEQGFAATRIAARPDAASLEALLEENS
ncbi:MAG: uroporphyrinogen-III synthase [Hyphomicrobiales bacterium]